MKNEHTKQHSLVEYGSYLIIPLKHNCKLTEIKDLCQRKGLVQTTIDSGDFNDIFKSMLNGESNNSVGICYSITPNQLIGTPKTHHIFKFISFNYEILTSYIFFFHTKVAFLCFGISYTDIGALKALCHPGKSEDQNSYNSINQINNFELNKQIVAFCKDLSSFLFFDNSYTIANQYTYTIALCDKWFESTKEIEQKTFKLHQMLSFDSEIEDFSEDDIEYVFSVKNEQTNSYRWGCCIASQMFTHVLAKDSKKYCNIKNAMIAEAQNTLSIIIFAQYERYTCQRFTLEINQSLYNKKQLTEIKKDMLSFRAYGTFPAADISHYYNVKQIYRKLSKLNDSERAIDDIESKLKLLADHQQELSQRKSDWLFYFITILGAISIVESAQSIVLNWILDFQLIWVVTIVSLLLIIVIVALSRFKK